MILTAVVYMCAHIHIAVVVKQILLLLQSIFYYWVVVLKDYSWLYYILGVIASSVVWFWIKTIVTTLFTTLNLNLTSVASTTSACSAALVAPVISLTLQKHCYVPPSQSIAAHIRCILKYIWMSSLNYSLSWVGHWKWEPVWCRFSRYKTTKQIHS